MPAEGRSLGPPTPLIPFWLEPYVEAVGVGSEQEETIAEVRGADGCRGNAVPFATPPARDHVPDDLREGSPAVDGEQTGHVFDEQDARVALDGDSPDIGPEPSLVVDTASVARDACRLAREPRSDEIHRSSPSSCVERGEVTPDRSDVQGRSAHPSHEHGRAVGLPLNSTNKSVIGAGKSDAQIEPGDAGAECQGAESHN